MHATESTMTGFQTVLLLIFYAKGRTQTGAEPYDERSEPNLAGLTMRYGAWAKQSAATFGVSRFEKDREYRRFSMSSSLIHT